MAGEATTGRYHRRAAWSRNSRRGEGGLHLGTPGYTWAHVRTPGACAERVGSGQAPRLWRGEGAHRTTGFRPLLSLRKAPTLAGGQQPRHSPRHQGADHEQLRAQGGQVLENHPLPRHVRGAGGGAGAGAGPQWAGPGRDGSLVRKSGATGAGAGPREGGAGKCGSRGGGRGAGAGPRRQGGAGAESGRPPPVCGLPRGSEHAQCGGAWADPALRSLAGLPAPPREGPPARRRPASPAWPPRPRAPTPQRSVPQLSHHQLRVPWCMRSSAPSAQWPCCQLSSAGQGPGARAACLGLPEGRDRQDSGHHPGR